jgi:hypothetical protein
MTPTPLPLTMVLLIIISLEVASAQNKVWAREQVNLVLDAGIESLPDYWRSGEINGKVRRLSSNEVERTKRIISNAFSKYPNAVLSENLERVCVFGKMEFYGLGYGGTYYKNTVYLVNKGDEMGYDDEWIEQSFHHEFSSVLLKKYDRYFNEEAWRNCNSADFNYGNGGVDALASGNCDTDFSEHYNRMGLLNQYGSSDIEEDVNEFAENLFLPHDGFAEVLQQYPSIRKKRALLIDFYHRINPEFTTEYFHQILEQKSKVDLSKN